ncbi:Tetratricopeptide repeat protein [Gimesia fumaroli]|uniref:Tetratricopeptide repeat protein n=2 Tax=Gimesia fumaroli TaxID=2527976 RepID=A0A518IB90_9PLAN|nr:Tetratricopeptide repeat protein [Gimesia fumaroli]
MIIYGSRMYFKENVVNSQGTCEHCGHYTSQTSYEARKFGHIYFIPLFPAGPRSQILNECGKCGMGTHIPLEQMEPIREDIRGNFKNWIEQVQSGKNEIHLDDDPEPINVGLLFSGALENLYLLQEIDDANSILAVLKSQEMHHEAEIVSARWHEIQGNLDRAVQSYQAAHELSPEDIFILYRIGKMERLMGKTGKAMQAFEKCLSIEPDNLDVIIEIAGIHENANDYPKIVETYDKIYDLRPDLVSEKGMKKVYKKACKKSGVEGKYQ